MKNLFYICTYRLSSLPFFIKQPRVWWTHLRHVVLTWRDLGQELPVDEYISLCRGILIVEWSSKINELKRQQEVKGSCVQPLLLNVWQITEQNRRCLDKIRAGHLREASDMSLLFYLSWYWLILLFFRFQCINHDRVDHYESRSSSWLINPRLVQSDRFIWLVANNSWPRRLLFISLQMSLESLFKGLQLHNNTTNHLVTRLEAPKIQPNFSFVEHFEGI
jgi:hypothetical protein